MVTTDLANEFAALDRELPEAVHRTKRPEKRNAIAAVDRGIQTLKKDLATRVARKAGTTSSGRPGPNARPHETVHGAPEDVEKQFRVLQDNADKFQHNKDLTDRRVKAVEDAGAFRAPTNVARSFNPSVRRRAAAGGRGLHDRPQHGGARPAEAGHEAECRRAAWSAATHGLRAAALRLQHAHRDQHLRLLGVAGCFSTSSGAPCTVLWGRAL